MGNYRILYLQELLHTYPKFEQVKAFFAPCEWGIHPCTTHEQKKYSLFVHILVFCELKVQKYTVLHFFYHVY